MADLKVLGYAVITVSGSVYEVRDGHIARWAIEDGDLQGWDEGERLALALEPTRPEPGERFRFELVQDDVPWREARRCCITTSQVVLCADVVETDYLWTGDVEFVPAPWPVER